MQAQVEFYSLQFMGANVQGYPYRTAKVVGSNRISIPRSICENLEHWLASKAGWSHPDNHSCYAVFSNENLSGNPLYFWFTDDHVFVGTQLQIQSY